MSEPQGDVPHLNKVLPCCFSPCCCFENVDIVVHYDIANRIIEIRRSLDALPQEREPYGLSVIHIEVMSSKCQARQLTSSMVNRSEIHGGEHDKEVIICRLLGGSSHHQNVGSVVSIVVMGDFGKTTHAKLVLIDDRVQKNIEKMWVCVSEPFELIRVPRAIIQQVNEKARNVKEWEAWHRHLCDSIEGKKFAVVLNDVWADNDHWSPLKLSLDGGGSGSRIIVATQDQRVTRRMRSIVGCCLEI